MAHITSDGLTNLLRVQSPVGYVLETLPEPQPVFRLLQRLGGVARRGDVPGLQHGRRLLPGGCGRRTPIGRWRRSVDREPHPWLSWVTRSPIRTGPSACPTAWWAKATTSGAAARSGQVPRRHARTRGKEVGWLWPIDVLLKGGTVGRSARGPASRPPTSPWPAGRSSRSPRTWIPPCAREVFDLRGPVVLPGIVDMHMHASAWLGGRRGPQDDGRGRRDDGPGHVGPHRQRPGHRPGPRGRPEHRLHRGGPTRPDGAGHRSGPGGAPGTPRRKPAQGGHRLQAARRALSAHPRGHGPDHRAGECAPAPTSPSMPAASTQGSNIEGFLQAVELARATRPPHRPRQQLLPGRRPPLDAGDGRGHRGARRPTPTCARKATCRPLNGTSAKCSGGAPESRVTQHCLTVGGFPPTEAGFEAAILAGWAADQRRGGRPASSSGQARPPGTTGGSATPTPR